MRRCLAALDRDGSVAPFKLGTEDAVDRFEPPQKLYGRSAEAKTLLASFERVARGGVETITIAGQAGIGKTSLVQEIYQPVTGRRGYFVSGKFEQLEQNVPFSAFVGALRELVQQLLTESEEEIAAWRERIRQAVAPNGQLIVDVVPELGLIIGPQPRVPELEALEAQNRFYLAFQNFVQVFCKREHPLVLFLDDMQWADPASLNLVGLIVAARATESLLLVLTYRDTEVSATHPFMLAIKEQAKQGVPVHTIELKSLGVAEVAEFVADTLHQDHATVAPLAEIIQQKTGGNPFFMRQFLQALHGKGLIKFDATKRAFLYDAEAVRDAAITENVAELLAAKLQRLPVATRATLRTAAVIGGRFELRVLATVQGLSPAETDASLRPAIEDGLVVPLTGLESLDTDGQSPLVYGRFAFRHDRVQQAAYALLFESERPTLHLGIGRALLAVIPPLELEGRLFDIVGHLNHGRELIRDDAERRRLADLNRRVGTKARDSTAYGLAVRSFRIAVELAGPQAWQQDYAAQYDTHRRLAEALGLTAEAAEALPVLDTALQQAASLVDRASLSAVRTNVLQMLGRLPEALACGRAAAREFGIDLPDQPEQVRAMLQREIQFIRERSKTIGIDKLLDLPPMQDPGTITLMGLLSHCLPAAYQSDQESYALLCCAMLRLSLEHGNCGLSARAYGSFGALLSGVLAEYEDAYRFTKVGVDLAHKLGETSILSGVYMLHGVFASHGVDPIDASIPVFDRSIEFGLQTGDHLHAGYSVARRLTHLQSRGMPLNDLRADAEAGLELLRRLNDTTNQEFVEVRLKLVDWLRGERPGGNKLAIDEAELGAAIHARGNRSVESDWYMVLTAQRYFAGDFRDAYEIARIAEGLQTFTAGYNTRGEHALFYALSIAALYVDAPAAKRAEFDAELVPLRRQLARLAGLCAANHEHLHLLVEAECARLTGARIEAADLYDRAIASARQHAFLNIESLACDLAARFWFRDGKPEFSRIYLEKALGAYEAWGASGMVADLVARHGLNAGHGATVSITAGAATAGPAERSDSLDLSALLKANQAIAGEIVLEQLLAKLLDIVRENAGAESVVLLLESDGEFLVQGVKTAAAEASVLMAEPLRLSSVCSKGIVNYVLRTSEHVVLDDAAQRGKFRNDPYVGEHKPKSVLCVPVSHQGKLIGAVYLENNQVAGAFTPGRLEALNILMSQIAVSIENATLYSKQEQQRRTIEAANETLTREITERKRAEQELGRYRDHLEELVKERTKELESAQGRLVDMSRRAGMAEVASGVLHNVGNVMNSVNVGASVARDTVKALPVEGVSRAVGLIDENSARLAEYLAVDPVGRKLPDYLRKLGATLVEEKQAILGNIEQLSVHLEHMKKIIAAQQSYAKVNGMTEVCTLEEIAETALQISEAALRGANIEIVRDYEKLPAVLVDRHQIMQIVVNLVSNAKHALEDSSQPNRQLKVAIARVEGGVRVEVRDNGIGIAPENLPKIFSHGFTTKKTGHGFGLHNCANAAQQMDGSLTAYSDGLGKGASFVLRMPVEYAEELPQRIGFAEAGALR